ncbi:MAG: penicillin acylase family protein [Woeseiaceae bacterium]|nr:penicillin acylase family protein [Woeseiaceae bacterium]
MKTLLMRILAGAVMLVAILALTMWLAVRGSLPQLDGDIVADGLTGSASIERDADGIPVISATTREDLAFATGFAHGQDRFFQMDLIRRRTAGELSKLVGERAVPVDKRYRFHRFRALARDVLARADESDRRVIERYADGVNAGLGSLNARPFEYLLLGETPEPWIAEDSLLVVYAMFMTLNDSRARKDVRRGYAHRVLPTGVYDWLYPDGTSWDAPLNGEPRAPAAFPPSHIYSVRHSGGEPAPAGEEGRHPLPGSNNWAVAGTLTTSGRAMVSNDMHLGLNTPNIYYQARIVQTEGEQRDITGVTLPGTPFVVAGSNGSVAWGYTNSYGDWSDAVVLKPGTEPSTYRTPDGDRAFELHHETIRVKDAEPVDYVVRETIWGPVDDQVSYPDGEIAVSWLAHQPTAVNLNIMALETATSVAEALDIANTMGMPPQNFVVGDASGNIGWTIAGQIPVKNGFEKMVPSDWSDEHGWVGWREPAEYPRVVNPESGRIWTANARVVDAGDLEIIGDGGYDLAARARQIRDGLFAKDTFTAEDMLAIQYDDRAVFLSRWRELLLSVLDDETVGDDETLVEYRRLVTDWVPRAAADSVGYRLVRGFRLEVRKRVFHGLMAPVREHYGGDVDVLIGNQFEAPLWQLVKERPLHLLSGEYESWDALLMAAVRGNIGYLQANYDGRLNERTWGEYNTATIRHPLSNGLPWLAGWLDMPRDPLNGDDNLPKAQGPGFGASERFSVAPGDEANGILHMPTGQSGHPLSDFYRRGHDDWVHGRPSPFLPGAAVYTLNLEPAGATLAADDTLGGTGTGHNGQ